MLIDQLDLDGYDIVFVNFDNGVDFLQNNAFLVQRVIRWVNENKVGTEPNVMLGQSMGGLISQYALRDLEVNGGPAHQVRLLITHDSPHRGANAPLSAQAAVRHLAGLRISSPLPGTGNFSFVVADEFPQLRNAYDLLVAPASQQLLTYGTTGFGANANSAAVGNTAHDQWQAEYDALGLPQGSAQIPCRVVATSAGAECARSQAFGPGANLLSISGGAEVFRFEWWHAVLGSVRLSGAIPATLLNPGRLAMLLPFLGAYDARVTFRLNALPDQQTREVYHAALSIQKRRPILGLIPLSVQLLSKTVNSRPEMLPLDSAPGSTQGADVATLGLPAGGLPAGVSFSLGSASFCFVPTPSALGVPLTGGSPVLNRPYSPSQRLSYGSPYANVVTAGQGNLRHIEYDTHNSTWILNEVRGTPTALDCLGYCRGELSITGPTAICPGDPAPRSYTVANLPSGASVAWSIDPPGALSQIGGNTGATFTVQAPNATNATIRATVGACGPALNLSLPVAVTQGYVEAELELFGASRVCPGSPAVVRARGANLVAPYTWTRAVAGRQPVTITTTAPELPAFMVAYDVIEVSVSAKDRCGGQDLPPAYLTITPENCDLQPAEVRLYPNPADAYVEVSTRPGQAPPSPPLPNQANPHAFQVRLHDDRGQVVATGSTQDGLLRLDTAQLRPGLYHLLVERGRQTLRRNLSIQH